MPLVTPAEATDGPSDPPRMKSGEMTQPTRCGIARDKVATRGIAEVERAVNAGQSLIRFVGE